MLGGHDIFVHGSGSNYNGGFTVRDMSADASPLFTVAPIGSVGYTSGNVSCGSFFAVQRVDEYTVNLYEYCMAGGYAGYQIKIKNSPTGIHAVETEAAKPQLTVYPNPAIDNISLSYPAGINHVAITNLAGATILTDKYAGTKRALIDVSALPAGFYIVTINGSEASTRIIKQ